MNIPQPLTGRLLVAAALLLAGVLLVAPAAVSEASPPGEPILEIEQEVVDIANQERARRGTDPLIVNYSLQEAAWVHNEHMVDTDCFSHTACGDGDPGDRIAATGYKHTTWGENIAVGSRTAAAVMDQWMNSPPHRRNILNRGFTDIGVAWNSEGVARYPGATWTQVFGAPASGYSTVTPPSSDEPGEPDVCENVYDFDGDCQTTAADVEDIEGRFMAVPGDDRWDPAYDVVPDEIINVRDIYAVVQAMHAEEG